jgi:uncharacterized protein (TIGR02145 family)
MSRNKAWIQYTKKGSIVPGSLIVSANRPKNGIWYEVIENICCDTEPPFGVISSKKKAFVKYDSQGNIVPGSLIVTGKLPKPGIWKEVVINACCSTGNIVNKWFLYNVFAPAELNGAITFPDKDLSEGSLDPNQVGAVEGAVQLYINTNTQDGVDNSAELLQLVGNYGNLTLTQGTNSVTYYFIPGAFDTITLGSFTNVYFDSVNGTTPFGTISVVSPASGPFNETEPISITVSVLTPISKYYNVAGCERMEYHVIEYTGNDALIDGTIVSNDTPECWYVTTETANTPDVGTITSIWSTDGQCSTCTSITIGIQEWTGINLDVDRYRNGDLIPQVTNPAQWAALTTGAWCYYNNDPANGPIYGKLYNWYAVTDPRGLAPVGYHVPSNPEYLTLETTLGGNILTAGGAMKETGTVHWDAPNTGATNSSGFTGLGGGGCDQFQNFSTLKAYGNFWTTRDYSPTEGTVITISTYDTLFAQTFVEKKRGYSVRLLRD